MASTLRFTAALSVVVLVVGCAESIAPDADLIGTYDLVSVNGTALPVEVDTDDGPMEVVSGQFVVGEGGSCTGAITVREPDTDPTFTLSNTCTWTRSGTTVQVSWTNGGTDTATLQAGVLTLLADELGGLVLEFVKVT